MEEEEVELLRKTETKEELDWWYKYVKENEGNKKNSCQFAWC
jgi:hypothetical protein